MLYGYFFILVSTGGEVNLMELFYSIFARFILLPITYLLTIMLCKLTKIFNFCLSVIKVSFINKPFSSIVITIILCAVSILIVLRSVRDNKIGGNVNPSIFYFPSAEVISINSYAYIWRYILLVIYMSYSTKVLAFLLWKHCRFIQIFVLCIKEYFIHSPVLFIYVVSYSMNALILVGDVRMETIVSSNISLSDSVLSPQSGLSIGSVLSFSSESRSGFTMPILRKRRPISLPSSYESLISLNSDDLRSTRLYPSSSNSGSIVTRSLLTDVTTNLELVSPIHEKRMVYYQYGQMFNNLPNNQTQTLIDWLKQDSQNYQDINKKVDDKIVPILSYLKENRYLLTNYEFMNWLKTPLSNFVLEFQMLKILEEFYPNINEEEIIKRINYLYTDIDGYKVETLKLLFRKESTNRVLMGKLIQLTGYANHFIR